METRAKAVDLNALRAFVTVAESASFSAAAKKLGLPKWSVSRSVSALEAVMGVPLLHRTTRRVTLSPAGVVLQARVAPLLSSLDLATSVWPEDMGEPAGEVHVSVPSFFQTEAIAEVFTKFAERYPAVRVDVSFVNVSLDFVSEGFDIALWMGPAQLKDTSLVARRGWHLIGQFFASAKYLATRGMPASLDEMAAHEHVAYRDISSLWLEGPEGRVTFRPNIRVRSNSVFFMREVVQAGAGIGILPTFLVEEDIARKELVPVLPQYRSLDAYVYVIRPSTREVPLRTRVLSDFLYEYMKANPLPLPVELDARRRKTRAPG